MKPRNVHHLHAHAPTLDEVMSWIGFKATDVVGTQIGKVEDVYTVDGKAEWLLIKRRSHHILAPVKDAIGSGGNVLIPFDMDKVEGAPEVVPGKNVPDSVLEEARVHYGVGRRTGAA